MSLLDPYLIALLGLCALLGLVDFIIEAAIANRKADQLNKPWRDPDLLRKYRNRGVL